MNKTINKTIIFSLGIPAILSFGIMTMPPKVSADRAGYITPYGSTTFNQPIINTNINVPVSNPKPVIDSISPSSSNLGVGTKTITISGEGFVPNSIGRINSSNRPTTFIDSSHLLMQISGNDTYAYRSNGGFFITVFNPAPGGGYSNAASFTINKTVVSTPATADNVNDTTTNFSDTIQTENGNGANENFSDLASNAIFGSNSFYPSGLIQWISFAILILLIVILVRKVYGADKRYHASPMKHS